MRVVRGVAAFLGLVVLTGCSVQRHGLVVPESTTRGAPASAPATPSATGAGPTTSGSAGTVPSAMVVSRAGAPPGRFDAAALRDALLTVGELAPGWTVGTGTTTETGLPPTGCPPLDAVNDWPALQAVIGFYAGDGNTQLIEGISTSTPADARKLLDTTRQVIDQCLTITVRDDRGGSHTLQVSEPALPRLGDDTYAVRLGSDEFNFTSVMVRRGGEMLNVAAFTEKPDVTLLEPFARQAFEKLEQRLR